MSASKKGADRRGILCAGNWIIDHVKSISFWPAQETLANILSEQRGTGGSAYNVAVDLARFEVDVPVLGLGLVGDDPDGRFILSDCDGWGIDRRFLRTHPERGTAYTDVMAVADTGRRTFFHYRGVNALLAPEHFPVEEMTCRVASLGYLLLLDTLDGEDPEFGTVAARVLARLSDAGILTAIDVVSEDSDRFRKIVTPSLPHADYCVINEIEAGRITGRELRVDERLDRPELEAAARDLLDAGVRRQVVVHAPEGAFGLGRDGEALWQPGHRLPEESIAGTVGAGDAFFAGMLLGIHEGWDMARSLRFAHGAAVTCLSHPTTTGGVKSAREIESVASGLERRSD